MENGLSDDILQKAWEKDVTEEVIEARKETISYMNANLDELKEITENLKRERETLVSRMQEADTTEEEIEAYEHDLKQKDRDISTGERLHDVLEGIIHHYHRIWNNVKLSEEELRAHRRWVLESMAFLMSLDKDSGYDDICGLILGIRA